MRIVIKIGTSLLTTTDHTLNRGFLREIIAEIIELHRAGNDIAIVSSGAVASGRTEIKFDREKHEIPYRQALASVGQPILMEAYRELFGLNGVIVAQALLTNYDFINRENFLNTKNVFYTLFEKRIIPIVNENDVTTIAELKFGDNDMLSAKTAGMVSADLLCILTDVDGLFDDNPKKNPKAKIIPVVEKMTEKIRALAGRGASKVGTGGMRTKLDAADYVASAGIAMFILGGYRKNAVADAVLYYEQYSKYGRTHEAVKNPGTFFAPSGKTVDSGKKWLRPKIQKNAWIEVDAGAARAISTLGKSLLPSGITAVQGVFSRGDVVNVKHNSGVVAYGQVNYSSGDLENLKRHRSDEIEKMLGYSFGDEAIHRDRMVVPDFHLS